MRRQSTILRATVALAAAATVSLGGGSALAAPGHGYTETKLTGNNAGTAANTDAKLTNAWGLAESATSPIWTSDNHSGYSTVYNGQGQPFPIATPLQVKIPASASETTGTVAGPTGIVFYGGTGFVVTNGNNSGPARFIFDTEDGTISGWTAAADPANAINEYDNNDSGVVFKGLAIAPNGADTDIFATDFHDNNIKVFKRDWSQVTPSGTFTDPGVPSGFAPFGIQNIGGNIYVTYAKQLGPDNHDDQAGAGNGYVSVFDVNGVLQSHLIAGGVLNSPWGLAVAPAGFGDLAGDLLVGNFGDGKINAFDLATGAPEGSLSAASGSPIVNPGLWGLMFGSGSANGGGANTLLLTAGPNAESDGLLAAIDVAVAPSPTPGLPHRAASRTRRARAFPPGRSE